MSYTLQLNSMIDNLANAPLGERKESIMRYLENALNASKKEEDRLMFDHCIEALKLLRKTRHSLRLSGVQPGDLVSIENAIINLKTLHEEANSHFMSIFQTEMLIQLIFSLGALILSIVLTVIAILITTVYF
ncbi:MAG: hypothetical protein RR184_01210 [Citrobacter sp.]|uniref:hypothetical protein n=1 Tax=Citrobacter sp. TaxID=1896336 RepID=UPI002FC7F369